MSRLGSPRAQVALTAGVTAVLLVALVAAARLMFVSERDALLVSLLVLAAAVVTIRIAALVQRQRERDRAEAARRRLVAAVSHDLRTPIAALRLLAEAVDDEIVDEATRRRYLTTMHTHIRSLSTMIDDLFELSRIEAGDIDWALRQVDLAPLVDETVVAMQPEARARRVDIRSELGDTTLTAHADPERIQRVLFNLIRNAIRHTPADGSVVVRAEAATHAVEIEVADTGPGISADDRPHVFDTFYRGGDDSARGRNGAGLGLAIARAIIEIHGGRIWLVPASAGTRVRFSLHRDERPT